jgi:hypothetical protein
VPRAYGRIEEKKIKIENDKVEKFNTNNIQDFKNTFIFQKQKFRYKPTYEV